MRITSHGVTLHVLDFGGSTNQDILLLHGLAGSGNEWASTANWLTQHGRVIAIDQRGHGHSSSGLTDFSRDAYVEDAIQVIEQYCRAPIVLIGQSMGAINAFLVAAKRPDLVKALIVVEATPEPNPKAQQNIQNWLDSWPVPFQSLDEAKRFFGGDTLYSKTFVQSLIKDEKGYWPAFNKEDMINSLNDVVAQNYWNKWKKISCNTLIVGGDLSSTSKHDFKKMATSIPKGHYISIPKAGHDLHLDASNAWQVAVENFIQSL